ncbi:mitochondrial fission factor-like isoform X1 [Gadus chalcogrammus]|uniref:mitochondrial fission factor-like isoform X1 n=1 Tax=Gadus chalcogrammus TaxID=1042646 RepID=UPI0024C47EC4|nr:mitochondrial fission factor-like isoform X1 [Gadus chalcogrammus]
MASFSPYLAEAMHVPGRDRGFSESINHKCRVPDRLAVGGGQPSARGREEEAESRRRSKEPPVSYNMHIPDRLTYTEAPDLSPRPQFTSSKPANSTPLTLETCWEHQTYREGEFFHGEPLHSPMRRSYSDQGLGRTPPGTPTHLKHVGALHVHLASPPRPGGSVCQYPAVPGPAMEVQALPEPPPGLLSPYPLLQGAWLLGQQASQRLLQAVGHKYRFNYPETPARVRPAAEASGPVNKGVSRKRATESWSQDDEGGAVVEFIVLRRQVLKMSRRLAGLERQNTERRNTEALLFSLLLSACLLNGWLWIRR